MVLSLVLTVFTLALTEAARSIFLLCFLDCYWLSCGPPSIKLMAGWEPEACSVSTTAMSVVGAAATPLDGSRIYLLRCPARISFSIRNFKLW